MQDYYHLLVITPSSHIDLFKDFLTDTLPVGFEEDGDSLLVRSEDELETFAWGVEQFAEALQRAIGTTIDVEIKLSKEKNSDWVKSYQESITPIEISPFYIHPTWNEPKENLINIAIDPALAFGTGHHPTTASCLKLIASEVKKDQDLIDVGCGSGILSIAAAKLGAKIDACDTDEVSIENSKTNALLNNITYDHIWCGSALMAQKSYDIVVANIVADVLVFISNDLKKILKSNGVLILSGILNKYEDKVLSSYSEYKIKQRITEDEWVTLLLEKGL
jgi:ribosomal protein L11 methyltransferase